MNKFVKVMSYAAIFGTVGGLTFTGVDYAGNKIIGNTNKEVVSTSSPKVNIKTTKNSEDTDVTTTTAESSKSSNTSDGDVSKVAEKVLPSIVAIDVTVEQSISGFYNFGQESTTETTGSGSGIIIAKTDDYIYIATNNHVVEGAKKVSIKFNDNKVYTATVKGTDSSNDLAVVQVKVSDLKDNTLDNIKVATVGDSDTLKVGEQAIAIGNALGYGTSVTVGIISAKDREVTAEDVTMKLLQTDAAINPGNSGGALVDDSGNVIGINSAKYASEEIEGMGFAIPINTAISVIKNIIETDGNVSQNTAYLGISSGEVEKGYSEEMGIPAGVYVTDTLEGAAAERAGILRGDIIVSFNGEKIEQMSDLKTALSKVKPGDKVKVKVKRLENGSYVTKSVTCEMDEKPAENNN